MPGFWKFLGVRRTTKQLVALLLVIGTISARFPAQPAESIASFPRNWPTTIDEIRSRVAALDLTEAERRWESISWVDNLQQAVAFSRQLQRPIFVLGLAGNLDGRC